MRKFDMNVLQNCPPHLSGVATLPWEIPKSHFLNIIIHILQIIYVTLHTHPFNGPFPGLPRWAGTRKVKPIWILLKQETVSDSGISRAVCKSAPRSRQITTPAPPLLSFLQAGCPSCRPQPTASKHWRSINVTLEEKIVTVVLQL